MRRDRGRGRARHRADVLQAHGPRRDRCRPRRAGAAARRGLRAASCVPGACCFGWLFDDGSAPVGAQHLSGDACVVLPEPARFIVDPWLGAVREGGPAPAYRCERYFEAIHRRKGRARVPETGGGRQVTLGWATTVERTAALLSILPMK